MDKTYTDFSEYKEDRKKRNRKQKNAINRKASKHQRSKIKKRIDEDIKSIEDNKEGIKANIEKLSNKVNKDDRQVAELKQFCDDMIGFLKDKSSSKKRDFLNIKMGKLISSIHQKVEIALTKARSTVEEFKTKLRDFINQNKGATEEQLEKKRNEKGITSIKWYRLAIDGEDDIDYEKLKQNLNNLESFEGKLESFLESLRCTSELFNVEETIREMQEVFDNTDMKHLNEKNAGELIDELKSIQDDYVDSTSVINKLKSDSLKREKKQYTLEKREQKLIKLENSYKSIINDFNNMRIIDSSLDYIGRRATKLFFSCLYKIKSFLQFIGVLNSEIANARYLLKVFGS